MNDENIDTQSEEGATLSDEQLDQIAGGKRKLTLHQQKISRRNKKRSQIQAPDGPGILWEGGEKFINVDEYEGNDDD